MALINNTKLFQAAHKLAKATRSNYATYAAAFSAALVRCWDEARRLNKLVADAFRAATNKGAVAQLKAFAADTVASRLIKLGCKVWQGKRIYANYHAAEIFDAYDCCGRGRKAQMERAYFDIKANRWESNGFAPRAEFAA